VHSNYNVWGSSHANFKQKTEMETVSDGDGDGKRDRDGVQVSCHLWTSFIGCVSRYVSVSFGIGAGTRAGVQLSQMAGVRIRTVKQTKRLHQTVICTLKKKTNF